MRPPALPACSQALGAWGRGPAPRANRARFRPHFLKVSQNGGVSPKSHQKACHTPYSQNGSQKSPLGIPGIPFSVAFSHKELMGHFYRYSYIIVKMTKCRQDVHTSVTRRGRWLHVSDLPLVDLSETCLDATSARDSSDILNELVFRRFTGDYD